MASLETEFVRQWFTKADDDTCLEPARQAFEEAENIFKGNLTKDAKKQKIYFGSSTLEDVLATVKVAEARYGVHRNKNSRLRDGLSRFSSLLQHYANIVGVFVQHHPEYVALAWGAMKFVFVTFLNHESTILTLTNGLCQVASVLPRVKLSIILYPTPQMKRAVAQLYAYIMRFLVRAKGWFEENWLKHLWHSVSRPVEMRFTGLISDINTLSEAVNQLAMHGSWAEQREMHNKMDIGNAEMIAFRRDLTMRMDEISTSLNRLKAGAHINTNQTLTSAQALSIIAAVLRPASFDLAGALQRSTRMRNRRVQLSLTPSTYPWATPSLRRWSDSPGSSVMFVLINRSARLQAKDMAVSVIGLLRRAKVPVLWELDQGPPRSTLDVLRSLARQALQLSLIDKTEAFAAAMVSAPDSKTGEPHYLLQLLKLALQNVPCTYVVIHTETIWASNASGDGLQLPALLGNLLQDVRKDAVTNVKALFFRSASQESSQSTASSEVGFLEIRAPKPGAQRRGWRPKRLPVRRIEASR